MTFRVCLAFSVTLATSPLLHAAADKVALVIGNNTYPGDGELVTPLDNCVRDAGLISATLRQIGFSVTEVTEASRAKMEDALVAFQSAIPKGGTALIYFAGHGIEVDGQSYVLGTNSRLKARSLLSEEGMKAGTLAQFMVDAGAKSSFLFLDCCREAPPTEWLTRGIKKRGLADTKVDGDIIIAFAAKPGQSAQDAPTITGGSVTTQNSPYAQALAKWLPTGLKHTEFFQKVRTEVNALTSGQQRTWENGSFLEDYVFGSGGSSLQPSPLPAPPPADSYTAFAGTTPGERKLIEVAPGVTIPFHWCPPGTFTMGSPASEKAVLKAAGKEESFYSDEVEHEVTLTRGFWLAETEVTQGQWQAVMGTSLLQQAKNAILDDTLYTLGGKKQTWREWAGATKETDPTSRIGAQADTIPIYFINHGEAEDWCAKASRHARTNGWVITLPTEAQWEYACRAGAPRGMTYAGDFTILGEANAPELDSIAWYAGNSSVSYSGTGWSTDSWKEKQYPGGTAGPRRVGGKMANEWGLRDMIGNVWEWCADYHGEYPKGAVSDPSGPATGVNRVNRGGSWFNFTAACRAAARNDNEPGFRYQNLGFRPALVPSR